MYDRIRFIHIDYLIHYP